MSSVATTATIQRKPVVSDFSAAAPFEQTCHKCGAELSHSHGGPGVEAGEDAQKRIEELEAQVRILTGKATAAVDKLADYEDELRQLKSHPLSPAKSTPNLSLPLPHAPSSPRPSSSNAVRPALPTRLSNLLPTSTKRSPLHPYSSSPPSHPHLDTTTHTSADLLTLLTQEQTLRAAAESRVSQTNDELEELSAQLFTEANEMVAAERKARARLEERVEVLERRDREKRGRLEVLEGRLGRIERVRGLLGRGGGGE